MFAIDDRTGNVVTTVAVFLIAGLVLYLARGAFFILLLSLLVAYLLEPAVALVQRCFRLGPKNRTWAIVLVCVIGILMLGLLRYAFGPHLATQVRSFKAALPQSLQGLYSGKTAADLGARHGLTADEQQHIHNWLASNHDLITGLFQRGAESAAYIASRGVWLFAVPILAFFILRDGRYETNKIIEALGRGRHHAEPKRILAQVDAMLAKYIRGQLTLAGLSVIFYSVSMLLLGFPYAIALGVLGGALEFLPAVGWVASAAVILTIGFLTHAHWIWMAGLLVLWRLLQDYVNSPRIMGDSLKLQPLTVILVLIVGGQREALLARTSRYLSLPCCESSGWGLPRKGDSAGAISGQPLTQVEV